MNKKVQKSLQRSFVRKIIVRKGVQKFCKIQRKTPVPEYVFY